MSLGLLSVDYNKCLSKYKHMPLLFKDDQGQYKTYEMSICLLFIYIYIYIKSPAITNDVIW